MSALTTHEQESLRRDIAEIGDILWKHASGKVQELRRELLGTGRKRELTAKDEAQLKAFSERVFEDFCARSRRVATLVNRLLDEGPAAS